MLTIYDSRDLTKGRFIRQNNAWFATRFLSSDDIKFDPVIEHLMKEIDGAVPNGGQMNTPYGDDIPLDYLSTGCKTAINVYTSPETCFDVSCCGNNALLEILKFPDGKVYMSHFPYSCEDFDIEIEFISKEGKFQCYKYMELREKWYSSDGDDLDQPLWRPDTERKNVKVFDIISFQYFDTLFFFEFNSPIVTVRGNSGTGKTMFCDGLRQLCEQEPHASTYSDKVVVCDYEADRDDLIDILNSHKNHLIVVDNADSLLDQEIFEMVYDSENQFLLFGNGEMLSDNMAIIFDSTETVRPDGITGAKYEVNVKRLSYLRGGRKYFTKRKRSSDGELKFLLEGKRVPTRGEVIAALEGLGRSELFKHTEIGLFGSYANDTYNNKSNVNIVCKFHRDYDDDVICSILLKAEGFIRNKFNIPVECVDLEELENAYRTHIALAKKLGLPIARANRLTNILSEAVWLERQAPEPQAQRAEAQDTGRQAPEPAEPTTHIYFGVNSLPAQGFIIWNDTWFDEEVYQKVDITPEIAEIMKRIDGAEYIGNNRFQPAEQGTAQEQGGTAQEQGTAQELTALSLECKTVIDCMVAPDKIFNCAGLESNVLEEIIKLREARIYLPGIEGAESKAETGQEEEPKHFILHLSYGEREFNSYEDLCEWVKDQQDKKGK